MTLYKPTRLEQYVSELFKKIHIYEPSQISKRFIAEKLGIYLDFSEHKPVAYEDYDFKYINIYKYSTKKEQREQFYHELTHLLRHAGNQLELPNLMVEWQEWDCKNFMLYAAIPYNMINYVYEYDGNIKYLSDLFGVTENLIVQRLLQIKERRELYLLESGDL
jgi:hypothetical protein